MIITNNTEGNGKACSNCQHCTIKIDEKTSYPRCYCEWNKRYFSYLTMAIWQCKRWEKKKEDTDEQT